MRTPSAAWWSGRTGALPLCLVAACALFANCRPREANGPGSASHPSGIHVLADRWNGRPWVEHDAALASSLGAGPSTIVSTDVAAEGDRTGGFVSIAANQCLLVYARGSASIDDLDLFAFADDGTILGTDEDADPHPALVICPPLPTRAYVSARVTSGRGIVTVAVHSVVPAMADRVAEGMGARGRLGVEASRIEEWANLDAHVSAHRRLLGGHWEEIRRVAVQADARAPTRVTAMLEPNRCLDAFVVPGADFGALDVTLFDMDDRVLTRGVAMGSNRYGIVCSPVETQVSVEIRPHTGQGLCAVVLGRSPAGAEQLIGGPVRVYRIAPSSDLPVERARRAKPLRTLGYDEAVAVGSGTADVGRRVSFPIALTDGCSRLDIVAGRPLAGVSADLWDENGRSLASGESGDGPTLFVCGKASRARLDIEAISRPGPFAIELRREKTSPPVLVAHPVAAGRLLSLLAGEAGPFTATAGNGVQLIRLDPHSMKTFGIDLPAGRCAQVVAALEPGGSGVDLRVHDPQANEQLALVRGRVMAASRVCATVQAPRKLTGELRLSAGEADALVTAHILPAVPR